MTNIAAIDEWSLADLLPTMKASLCGAERAADDILERAEPDCTSRLYADASRRVDEACETSPFQDAWACKRGCSDCCHQSVPVTAVEAFELVALARARLSQHQLHSLLGQLRDRAARYSKLSSQELGYTRIRCAFLDQHGECSMHASRPLRCRGFHSFCAARCASVHQGRPVVVPIDPQTNVAMRGVQSGLSGALREQGRDGRYYELHSAALCALEIPDARDRWRRGEDVFAACARPSALPDDLWIAPQDDGSVVKLCRVKSPQAAPEIRLVYIQAGHVHEQPVWHIASAETEGTAARNDRKHSALRKPR